MAGIEFREHGGAKFLFASAGSQLNIHVAAKGKAMIYLADALDNLILAEQQDEYPKVGQCPAIRGDAPPLPAPLYPTFPG